MGQGTQTYGCVRWNNHCGGRIKPGRTVWVGVSYADGSNMTWSTTTE